MLSKLRDLSKFKKGNNDLIDISFIKTNLCNGLFRVMEDTFEKRKSDSINSKYTIEDVDKIIESYARKNMLIAAGASIIPGPFGILGAVPELLLTFNNQMSMIYDLGCASGRENFISKDVLLDIPLAAFGGNTNLVELQNSSTNLINSTESVLLDKATQLGQSIIERTLKKSIVQFIPVAGPILMGTWSKLATTKISSGSLKFLDNASVYIENIKPEESIEIQRQLQIEKIKGLANLIESNNEINEHQIELIGTIIENSELSESEKAYYLEESMKTGSKFKLDKELLIKYEEADDLIMELIIMAKRSGSIDELEKNYIYEIGSELGLNEQFIDKLI